MREMIKAACSCQQTPQGFAAYEPAGLIGVDEMNGRYGEVTLRRCKRCGQLWLHYQVEYEHLSGAGRYFMGLITPEAARDLEAGAAVRYLESLPWHLYGGSYFGAAGRATGKICVDG
jgi:hypothetical protein